MVKTSITGKTVKGHKDPPKNAFRFAAVVTFGRMRPRRKGTFSDENPDETAGELDGEPPPEELAGDAPPTEETPAEMADDVPAEQKPTEMDGVPVSIVARTGGVADQLYWGRCVHDFGGMSAPAVIPLDYMHDPMQIVGFANEIDASTGTLNVAGQILSFKPGDRAEEILFRSKAGTPYQASILMGWNDYVLEELPAGQTADVNGQSITGPVTIFRQWSLRGLAICPYGADAGTSIGFDGDEPPTEKPAELADDEHQVPADQLATDAPPTDEPPADELSGEVYLEEFGDRGGVYFAKGLSLSQARAQFAADMQAENARLQADLAKARGQLAAGTTPVTFQSGEPGQPQTPAGTAHLTPNLARFAGGLYFRK